MSDHRVDVLAKRAGDKEPVFSALRALLHEARFEEGFKWRQAAYMVGGKNAVILSVLKDGCALNFFQGALMQDPEGLLVVPGPNSQAARWMKFPTLDDVKAQEKIIRAYLADAHAIRASGQTVAFTARAELDYPEELLAAFEGDPALEEAFRGLTPGRQRSWVIYIAAAKQSATRSNRIAKGRDKIFAGKGQLEY